MNEEKIAILVPCFNEELTVARVVEGFRAALPGAAVHVFDNASTDRTARLRRKPGPKSRFLRCPRCRGSAVVFC